MSHLSSPPPKHKGEHKGHGLPRGSERWVGLGAGASRRDARGQGGVGRGSGVGVGGGWGEPLSLTHLLVPGVAPPGTRTAA